MSPWCNERSLTYLKKVTGYGRKFVCSLYKTMYGQWAIYLVRVFNYKDLIAIIDRENLL